MPVGHVGPGNALRSALTGWTLRRLNSPEFDRLDVPLQQPWRLLLQRLDDVGIEVRAHLDFASDDRAAEVARHLGHGAVVVAQGRVWTVLRPPAGPVYCVTDRDPRTGSLA